MLWCPSHLPRIMWLLQGRSSPSIQESQSISGLFESPHVFQLLTAELMLGGHSKNLTNLPLSDVFWPPSMTFIAWLPSEHTTPTEWCWKATECTNLRLFSLGGIDALQAHDYFSSTAYLTREGKRWADCRVTPESGRMGTCEGSQSTLR